MDFSAIGNSLGPALGAEIPRILGALLILIIGWTLAVVVRGGVRRLLAALRLNSRIAETTEQRVDVESWISAVAFWLIILITLIGMFNSLDLVLTSGPFEVLVKQIAAYLPRLVAGVLLMLVAWLVAVALARHRQPRARRQRPGRKALGRSRHAARCAEASATCFSGWSSCCSCPPS